MRPNSSPKILSAKQHIAFAADLPLADALQITKDIAPHVGVVKIGLSLFVEHGPKAVEAFQQLGMQIFLDLKLHDIPNTVLLATKQAAKLGVSYLTVHASGGQPMLEAALEGSSHSATPLKILAVTVLTSMDSPQLSSIGVTDSIEHQVLRLAQLAQKSGISGLVCSPLEAKNLKSTLTSKMFLCTPGIRPLGSAAGDQSRIETPSQAIKTGSDLLVIGRPISQSREPQLTASEIEREVRDALLTRGH
jgi:orotidine-5'-phosphate decarboxylase